MSWEIAIVTGVIASAFALLYIGNNLDEKHNILKFFFFFVGLFLLVANFSYGEHIISANSDTINNATIQDTLENQSSKMYGNFLWVVIASLSYFVYYIFYKIFTNWRSEKDG